MEFVYSPRELGTTAKHPGHEAHCPTLCKTCQVLMTRWLPESTFQHREWYLELCPFLAKTHTAHAGKGLKLGVSMFAFRYERKSK